MPERRESERASERESEKNSAWVAPRRGGRKYHSSLAEYVFFDDDAVKIVATRCARWQIKRFLERATSVISPTAGEEIRFARTRKTLSPGFPLSDTDNSLGQQRGALLGGGFDGGG